MIKVGFSYRASNPLSWLIRTLTKSEVSHAWILISPMLGQDMVLEATIEGVRMIPLSRFEEKNKVVCVVESDTDLMPGIKQAVTWLGSGYDFGGLFGMLFVMVGRWLHRKWTNPLSDIGGSSGMLCTEIVARVLQASNVNGAESLDVESINAQDLLDFLRAKNGIVSTP